jgi:hypothetical protein
MRSCPPERNDIARLFGREPDEGDLGQVNACASLANDLKSPKKVPDTSLNAFTSNYV